MFDEYLHSFLSFQQPWWVYALLILIPLCVLLSLREACCWFFKFNKMVNRLERIEAAILQAIELDPDANKPQTRGSEEESSSARRKGPSEL